MRRWVYQGGQVSAAQFVLDNIITVLGGAGVVVTSLSTYLGKRWADSALIKEKAKFETELKTIDNNHSMAIQLLEKDLQLEINKKDQFHQISKATYENLFNKKITVYTQLLKLKTDFDHFQYENGRFEYIDPTNDILSHFTLFKEKIENNRLYISNELSDKYDQWYKQASPFYQQLESTEMEIHVHAQPDTDPEALTQDVWHAQYPILEKLVNESYEKMSVVIKQIEIDVKAIKNSMNVVNT